MISDSKGVRPDRPFFAYLAVRRDPRPAPGAGRVPREVPRARSTRAGTSCAERWFERQLELGVDPARAPSSRRATPASSRGTTCPRTSSGWRAASRRRSPRSSTTPTTRSAGSSTASRDLGQLDNTIVVRADRQRRLAGGRPVRGDARDEVLQRHPRDARRGHRSASTTSAARTATPTTRGAGRSAATRPFKWYKQNTHEGGVHVPLIVHWPAGIAADQRGHEARPVRERRRHRARRSTTCSASTPPDDVPRASSSCRSPATRSPSSSHDADAPADQHAAVLRDGRQPGARRRRVEGGVQAPAGRRLRHRAVGAVPPRRRPVRVPRPRRASSPSKLAELVELWWAEAERHGVLPLDDRMIELFGARFRDRSPHPADRRYVYRPPMSPHARPGVGGDRRSQLRPHRPRHAVGRATRACSTRPAPRTRASRVFVQDDRFVVDYNAFDDHTVVESDVAVPDGDSALTARFRRGDGRAGIDRDRGRRRAPPAGPTCRCSCG